MTKVYVNGFDKNDWELTRMNLGQCILWKSEWIPITCGSIPQPIMGITRDFCRYIKALLTPYQGAITIGGIDLK